MGTFGTGPFDNDAALDWIEDFNQRKSFRKLTKSLEQFGRQELDAEALIACTEVLCAVAGYPHPELEPDIEDWSEKQQGKLSEETRWGTGCGAEAP